MRAHRSEFIQAVVERGFLHQATDLDALDQLAAEKRLTAYIGFDATADSLHVGNLVGIMLLRLFQRTGHRPIALAGGGTTKVGDPSGKEESRQLLTDERLAVNLEGIKRSLVGFLEVDEAGEKGLMVNNADWLDHLNYIQLLRDYGPHFTINRMLTFDSVKLRLDREQPLTFLEFNYMIMQAYDFVELARRYDCVLQMGGSDQWGNIVNGVELGRRVDQRTLFGLTTPLITTASAPRWASRSRAPSGSIPNGFRISTTGNIGATPKTPMSAVFCDFSPTCRWTRSRSSKRSRVRRSTKRRRCSPSRRRSSAVASRPPTMPPPPPARCSRRARMVWTATVASKACPRSRSTMVSSRTASASSTSCSAPGW